MIEKNDLNEKLTSKRINMTYEEIKEKFEDIKYEYGTVETAKKNIKVEKIKFNEEREKILKSETDREYRDQRIEQINKNLAREEKKIEKYNGLIKEFFEHLDPNDIKISVNDDNDIYINCDKVNNEIHYINEKFGDNFTYKIENNKQFAM